MVKQKELCQEEESNFNNAIKAVAKEVEKKDENNSSANYQDIDFR